MSGRLSQAARECQQFGVGDVPGSSTCLGADKDGSPSLRVADNLGVTFPPQTLPSLLLSAAQKKWRHNEYFIRMGGVPVMVDVNYDLDCDGIDQHKHSTVRVTVHGECPDCAIKDQADSAEFSREYTSLDVETITCSCGNAWTLERGVPEEYR